MCVRIDAKQDPLIASAKASSVSAMVAANETSQIIYSNFAESSDVFRFFFFYFIYNCKKALRVDEK